MTLFKFVSIWVPMLFVVSTCIVHGDNSTDSLLFYSAINGIAILAWFVLLMLKVGFGVDIYLKNSKTKEDKQPSPKTTSNTHIPNEEKEKLQITIGYFIISVIITLIVLLATIVESSKPNPKDFGFCMMLSGIFIGVTIILGMKWYALKTTLKKTKNPIQTSTNDIENEPIEKTNNSEEINSSFILDFWNNKVNYEDFAASFVKAHDVLNNILNHPQGMAYLNSSPKGRQAIDSMIQALENHHDVLKDFEEKCLGGSVEEASDDDIPDDILELIEEPQEAVVEEQITENEKTTNPSSEAEKILNAWHQLVDFNSFQQSFVHAHELLDEVFVSPKGEEYMKSSPKPRLKVDSMIEMLKLQKYKTEQFEKHYLGEKNKNS